MTEQEQQSPDEAPKNRLKRSYIIGLVLLVAGVLVGFLEVRTELLTHQIKDLKATFFEEKKVISSRMSLLFQLIRSLFNYVEQNPVGI